MIDLGANTRFNQIVMWWHGSEHTPQTAMIEYWDGSQWLLVDSVQRTYGMMHAEGSNGGGADSDLYDFTTVIGSKVRYSFDNCGYNINGTLNVHGWLYEFEVFNSP